LIRECNDELLNAPAFIGTDVRGSDPMDKRAVRWINSELLRGTIAAGAAKYWHVDHLCDNGPWIEFLPDEYASRDERWQAGDNRLTGCAGANRVMEDKDGNYRLKGSKWLEQAAA
jgi:hypothetical protein